MPGSEGRGTTKHLTPFLFCFALFSIFVLLLYLFIYYFFFVAFVVGKRSSLNSIRVREMEEMRHICLFVIGIERLVYYFFSFSVTYRPTDQRVDS